MIMGPTDYTTQITVRPLIKGTPKEDNKGHTKCTLVYTLSTKYSLKEDSLSIKDKWMGPNGVHYSEVPLHVIAEPVPVGMHVGRGYKAC